LLSSATSVWDCNASDSGTDHAWRKKLIGDIISIDICLAASTNSSIDSTALGTNLS
jgi:hypothetical protein